MLRQMPRLLRRRSRRPVPNAIERFTAAGLFDAGFYQATYPDVVLAGEDPLKHFCMHGWREHRQSSAAFDPITYLAARPELVRRGTNAYLHVVEEGLSAGGLPIASDDPGLATSDDLRRTIAQGLFDETFYHDRHPDLAPGGQAALIHFMTIGARDGSDPSEAFHTLFYAIDNPDVLTSGIPPFLHYLRYGQAENRQPLPVESLDGAEALVEASGLFDADYYRLHTPVVGRTAVDPLQHYLLSGHKTFQRPSAAFDPIVYLSATPSGRGGRMPTLVHYLRNRPPAGSEIAAPQAEPRWVPGPGEMPAPDQDLARERMKGIAFFAGFGFEETADGGRTPSPFLDAAVAMLAARKPALISEGTPRVSIIIPVYGQLPFVLACLDSLSEHASRYAAEIVVVDDATPDTERTSVLGAIPWVRYDRRPANGGFIESCNHGARIAGGEFIIFLNSDTRLGLNWLDELIATFEVKPKAGLVGSKLYNEDGTLQEAGAIYWRNGSAWNYGRNDDGADPAYSFARLCDYCSGAAIAVRRAAFEEAGGFNRLYAPAYCEDSDLAFTLRQQGLEIWMQPRSRVIHYEGKSHGRDLTAGGKAYQVANMHRFAQRWAEVLAGHRQEGDQPAREANRGVTKRILIVDAVTPTPDRDSGSLITFQMMRAFQELGWQVSFVPQSNYLYSEGYTDQLQRLGIECFYAPFATRIDHALDRSQPFDVVLAYRVDVLHPILKLLRRRLPLARVIFHNVDLHYLREQRQAELFKDRSQRIKAARTQTEELETVMRSDAVIVHTPIERGIVEQQVSIRNIVEFPYIAEVHATEVPFAARTDIMFLGGFAHTPNIDAVEFFLDDVWPLLEHVLPETARFVVVGDRPPSAIRARSGGRVVVTGHVPELAPHFQRTRVFVAPLRYGAGIKGKVVQTLAHGVPSVCTPTAAEGMNMRDGDHALIAEDARSIADAVLRLYRDEALWRAIQRSGYAFVEDNYSWKKCLDLCNRVLDVSEETWIRREEALRARRLDRAAAELRLSHTAART